MIATDSYKLHTSIVFGSVSSKHLVLLKLLCSLYMTGAARLMFKGTNVPENSLVVRDAIGIPDANTLMCVTDYTPCFSNPLSVDCTGTTKIMCRFLPQTMVLQCHEVRDQVVWLRRPGNSGAEGIFWCRIQVNMH